jgi:hypothetical protein
MSKLQERADEGLPDATPEPKKASPSKGPWDPFRYLIKTISPQQRVELLRLQVPILPPEEFMTTRELRMARMARLRRWRPAFIGGGVLLLALVAAAVWFWGSPASVRPLPPPASVAQAPTGAAKTLDTPHVAAPTPAPPSAGTSLPSAAQAEAPSASAPLPALSASTAPTPAQKTRASSTEHSTATKVKPPSATSAPNGQTPHKPDGPDFEQPFNPQ